MIIPPYILNECINEYDRFDKGNLDGLRKKYQILRRSEAGAWDVVGEYDSKMDRDSKYQAIRLESAISTALFHFNIGGWMR